MCGVGRWVHRRWCNRSWLWSQSSSCRCSRCCRTRWPSVVSLATPPLPSPTTTTPERPCSDCDDAASNIPVKAMACHHLRQILNQHTLTMTMTDAINWAISTLSPKSRCSTFYWWILSHCWIHINAVTSHASYHCIKLLLSYTVLHKKYTTKSPVLIFINSCLLAIIFGTVTTEWICHRKMVWFPISPV